ncbi:Ldh family oxidoreductase [Streptomyces sp. AK02-01A]|uniref:Ldh family oxidoreductase n=1 Tax=Streptomyces sp. AK02-01A TaxID=3028648 RepID=UPI00299FC177|nr:Ldh family oxidoreductase [Streptomyces sp. AK02-01A]MDX3855780.1 Ldh family oxidoreductase [Streptomyces sp. AK02-01A]
MVTVVPAAQLDDYLVRLYRAAGMTRAGARTVAGAQVEADLRGVFGHGSRLAPGYAEKLRCGRLNPRPTVRAVQSGEGCLVLDGDLAPGALAARYAVEAATDRAHRTGLGLVAVRNAGHAGALGVPAAHLARLGLVGVLAAQTSSPSVAVLGGPGTALLGNCALAVAVPGPDAKRPVLVDLAAGAMSWGRLHEHARAGRELPEGCALDERGRATRDAAAATVLLPSGERGQALAIVLELLVGALTGSSTLPRGADGRGLLCLAIDPDRLGTATRLSGAVAEFAHALAEHSARLPGDRAWAHHDHARNHGIALNRHDLAALIAAGHPHVRAPRSWTQTTARPGINPTEAPL